MLRVPAYIRYAKIGADEATVTLACEAAVRHMLRMARLPCRVNTRGRHMVVRHPFA
jgi:hypothetical protein